VTSNRKTVRNKTNKIHERNKEECKRKNAALCFPLILSKVMPKNIEYMISIMTCILRGIINAKVACSKSLATKLKNKVKARITT